ncbi:MAG: phospholipase A [Gallionella sp.]|nr:phospholipase A [Gallionella sp.]
MLMRILCSTLLCLGLIPPAYADSAAFALCAKKFLDSDGERLKCFDSALLPATPAVAAVQPAPEITGTTEKQTEAHEPISRRSYLTRVWNLDNRPNRDQSSLDRLQPHRQSYLIVRKSSNVNAQPNSPAPAHTITTPFDMDAMEAKFQLSFKTDILTQENLDIWGLKTFRLWGAYSQQSHWQVFNTRNSSPFRETDYEPELIAAFATGRESGWKLFNLGLVHQSNGRTNETSRSWNRVYAQGGWEQDNTSLQVRGWWRIPETVLKDDNPDIAHYVGRAELVARWEPDNRSQSLALKLRNNMNWSNNLSFVQLDWSLPISLGSAARLHAQISNGYGESLIDYNHRQTTLGLGISFREW